MSRIAASLSNEREGIVYNIFATDPGATVASVQKDLETRDGFKMNLSRIYKIAAAARAKEPLPEKVKSPSKKRKAS